jgi:hypothetical protein
LQKEKSVRHTINITLVANKIIEQSYTEQYCLNRAEVICLLYYIQQNMETIIMNMESEEIPTWSIRDDIYKNLCACAE